MRISDWSSDVCSSDLFIVLAGGGSVTARGTVFDVILGKDKRVTVRLLRGAVDVERPQGVKGDRGAGAVARLEPGEVLSFAAIAPAVLPGISSKAAIEPVTLRPVLPLTREYDRTPLSAVVAKPNRTSAHNERWTGGDKGGQ